MIEADLTLAFQSQDSLDAYLSDYAKRMKDFEPDMGSVAGRKEIASQAYAVARRKTAIDEAGKTVKDEAQKRVDAVNQMRRVAKDRLEGLQDEIRKPLTQWETQEKARVDSCMAIIEEMKAAALVLADDTSAAVKARLERVRAIEITKSDWQELFDAGVQRKAEAIAVLEPALARLLKAEADQAELERLRADAAKRDQEEAERQERERALKAEEEAKRQAGIDRANAEAAAAERAKREAEEKAQREKDEAERKHKAELDRLEAEKAALLKAQQDAEAEAERKRKAEEDERLRREADVAHRSSIMSAAKEAIMEHGGIKEEAAKKIVLAITGGNVPHTTIKF
jgi:hypothetical protein